MATETATTNNKRRASARVVRKATDIGDIKSTLGVSGLRKAGYGAIDEEFLPQLKGKKKYKTFQEMSENDAVIGAMLFAIELLIRNVEWRTEGEDEAGVEFLNELLEDMDQSWDETLCSILSALTYGFSLHEILYKTRGGETTDLTTNSKYSDGKLGWRRFAIRSQDTIIGWNYEEEVLVSATQESQETYEPIELPMEKCLLFRVRAPKDNPEGYSLLRNAYRPWYHKKKIENIQSIGIERDLAGLPVIYRDAETAIEYDTLLEDIIRNVRRDEQEGVMLPMILDEDGNKLLTFELLSSAGTRQIDVGAAIMYHAKQIAMTVLADFLFLGQDKAGSFALSADKTEMFTLGIKAIVKSVAGVVNRYAIPRLWRLNKLPVDSLPRIVPGKVDAVDLEALGRFIGDLSGAGAPLFPDDDLENHLRQAADLPLKADNGFA